MKLLLKDRNNGISAKTRQYGIIALYVNKGYYNYKRTFLNIMYKLDKVYTFMEEYGNINIRRLDKIIKMMDKHIKIINLKKLKTKN